MKKKRVKHHIRNRVDGGKSILQNLLLMDDEREKAFHKIFGHLTLREASKLLLRVARAKEAQDEN